MQRLVTAYKSILVASSIVYGASLLLLLSKNEGDMRATLRGFDPTISAPAQAANLAASCGINNVLVALYDVHVITHVLGWYITTLAFRDVAFSWGCGLIWEVIEGSFENNVLELKECWWDKVFMDLLGCNNIGIFLGWLTLRYLKLEEYNWAQISTPDGSRLHEVGVLYFIPGRHTFQQNYYGILKSAKSCMLFIYAHLVIILLQLNLFVLKTALWIPTVHWMPSFRSYIIASLLLFSGTPVYKHHQFTGLPLLMNSILAIEGLLVLRFGGNLLFTGKGDTFTTMIMILSIFVFLILSVVGVAQTIASLYKSANPSASCRTKEVKAH